MSNPALYVVVVHSGHMLRRLTIAAALVVALANAAAAQTDVSVLVNRASTYVERFQQSFGSVVAEERYEQKLRRIPNPTSTSVQQRGGGGPAETTLVSDFLLVEVKGEGWLPFRDVFERDGKPVRDREQRLAAIFLKGGRDAFSRRAPSWTKARDTTSATSTGTSTLPPCRLHS